MRGEIDQLAAEHRAIEIALYNTKAALQQRDEEVKSLRADAQERIACMEAEAQQEVTRLKNAAQIALAELQADARTASELQTSLSTQAALEHGAMETRV